MGKDLLNVILPGKYVPRKKKILSKTKAHTNASVEKKSQNIPAPKKECSTGKKECNSTKESASND
jgi:hypothetical protein